MNKNIEEKVKQLRTECKAMRKAANTLTNSGMKEKTVLILLHHYTKLPQSTIKRVLEGLEEFEEYYFGEDE